MSKNFNKATLTRIIDAKYPTETKVAEIIALYKSDRINLLNRVSNMIGHVIDENRYGKEDEQ